MLLAVGCGAPKVQVAYDLPGALAIPPEVRSIEVGQVNVSPGFWQGKRDNLEDALRSCMPAEYRPDDGAAAEAVLMAEAFIESAEKKGARAVRVWASRDEPMAERVMPTLHRRLDVRVVFTLTGADGRRLLAAEDRKTYNSLEDPRVRGEDGLGRPDDPDRVPPAELLVGEMLHAAAETFCGMIAPVSTQAEHAFRQVDAKASGEAQRTAARGDYAVAVAMYQTAALERPDDADAQFNLGLAAEAAGDLALSEQAYGRAVELSNRNDTEAVNALARVRHVRLLRKN